MLYGRGGARFSGDFDLPFPTLGQESGVAPPLEPRVLAVYFLIWCFYKKSARFMDIASFMALVRFHKMLVFLYSHIFENS